MSCDKKYWIPGKLMLAGEYAVLKGATALSVPTKYGQTFCFSPQEEGCTVSTKFREELVFQGCFDGNGKVVATSDESKGNFISSVLKAIYDLTRKDLPAFNLMIQSDFPLEWGLGSSSAFLTGMSRYLHIDVMELNEHLGHSSGYDVATQWHQQPILYKRMNEKPQILPVSLDYAFANSLYFVWTGKKRSTAESVKQHKHKLNRNDLVRSIDPFVTQMAFATTLDGFANALQAHESFMSQILAEATLKDKVSHLSDIPVKSLGAWGGDFILLVWQKDPHELKQLIEEAGFDTLIPWKDMVLTHEKQQVAPSLAYTYKRQPLSVSSIPEYSLKAQWQAPANIALVKYWGKAGEQLPLTPSISFSLKNSVTRTSMVLQPAKSFGYVLQNKQQQGWRKKMDLFFDRIKPYFPFLEKSKLLIDTVNTFPHGVGMASSASGFAALALCLCDLEKQMLKTVTSEDEFFRKASFIARLGSGSASRSVWGGFSWWGRSVVFPESEQEIAVPYKSVDGIWKNLRDTIILVDAKEKPVSSSEGHSRFMQHPYQDGRLTQASRHLQLLKKSLYETDWALFQHIVEQEALSLHALMMSADPGYILMQPETLKVWKMVTDFREETGTQVAMTMDAGPTVHLIHPPKAHEGLQPLFDELKKLGVDMIHDEVGTGPEDLSTTNLHA